MEAQETSKAAKLAYEKFSAEAAEHAKHIDSLESLKEEKLAGKNPCHRTTLCSSARCKIEDSMAIFL